MTTERDSDLKRRMREDVIRKRKAALGITDTPATPPAPEEPLVIDPAPSGKQWLHERIGIPIPAGRKPCLIPKYDPEDFCVEVRHWIPKEAPNYQYRNEFYDFAVVMSMGLRGALVGESGTGKDYMVKQYAALVGQPYRRITGDKRMTSDMLVGRLDLQNGSMGWVKGELQIAVESGVLLVVAEPFAMPPDTSFAMQSLNERGGYLSMPEHPDASMRMLTPHPLFNAVFTTNVRGFGDANDKFAATGVMDASFLNRIEYMQEVPHLDPSVEASLILGTVKGDDRLAMRMVRFGNLLRQAWREGTLEASWSMRSLVPWAELTSQLDDAALAFKMTFWGKLISDDERGLVSRCWHDAGMEGSL